MNKGLCSILLSKIDEQIERTCHLISLLPENMLDWRPANSTMFSTAFLLGHLLECLAGFCAVLHAANREALKHFSELKGLPVNHHCDKDEALLRVAAYKACIHEGFVLLRDEQLGTMLPTVFVKGGEALLSLLVGNLEHLINHKHQLFTYLKLMGGEVRSDDLYQFRG